MRKMPGVLVLLALAAAAPAALAGPVDKAQAVTGMVAKIQASERTVAVTLPDGAEVRFLWNAETKISGVLTPGAKVTIRYIAGGDGQSVALQITVLRS